MEGEEYGSDKVDNVLNNESEISIEEEGINGFDFPSDFFTEKQIDEEKLARMDLVKENRLKYIEHIRKEKRKITREKRKENHKKKLYSLTKEERIRNYNIRQEEYKKQEENLKKGLQSDYTIVYDLDYTNLMKTREIKSLASQISYCYSLNKKIQNPFRIHICSYEGEAKYELESMGSKNWHANFHAEKFSEIETLVKSGKEFMYLSPDSPNILQEINQNTIYIVGGFVDKPVSKFRSLDKANGLNIKTGRLPLEEHLPLLSNPVLNINNVIEIISRFLETQDWEKTIKELIPTRMLYKK